ncbi:MAG: hypothetical protein EKK64_00600 [Neisseriaceae bacterium]|nr:MAG: hypothetical protein EKK64_00600 [Neisseriaceae bacterium]
MPVTFNDKEVAALYTIAKFAASRCGGGEDLIGLIMYTGAFHALKDECPDGAVIDLVKKLELGKDKNNVME